MVRQKTPPEWMFDRMVLDYRNQRVKLVQSLKSCGLTLRQIVTIMKMVNALEGMVAQLEEEART